MNNITPDPIKLVDDIAILFNGMPLNFSLSILDNVKEYLSDMAEVKL